MTPLPRVARITSGQKWHVIVSTDVKPDEMHMKYNKITGQTYMHEGPFMSLRYLQVPWIQKSLYFFRHGFLFFPFPFPFAFFLPKPFLLEPSSLSAFNTALGSFGLLENATVCVKEEILIFKVKSQQQLL